MIVVKLIGGLGNQLFQYAIGKNLAVINNTDLYIDISGFEEYKLHEYSLQHFNIKAEIASPELLKYAKDKSFPYFFSKKKILIEKKYLFKPSILNRKNAKVIYVDGYWQSEKYFKSIYGEILGDLKLKSELSNDDHLVLNKINDLQPAVSIHVRRGDYVSNNTFNKVHGVSGLDYYLSAIDYINSIIENPRYFVFSDDIEWCKQNLNLKNNVVFCEHNTAARNFADLYLMSQCKHNIIANSSFSWWGAWLNANSDKIVIAPKTWYADGTKNSQTKDLIPVEWIRL